MKTGKRKLFFGILLPLLFCAIPAESQGARVGVDVELSPQNALHLQISLRSLANTRATIYKSDLPWGLRDSIILVGVISNQRYLDEWPIGGDPTPQQISLNPNESVRGEIDLTKVFKNIDVAVTKSDVQVFWAYRAPAGLGLPHWTGGWVLIPQQKQKKEGAHD